MKSKQTNNILNYYKKIMTSKKNKQSEFETKANYYIHESMKYKHNNEHEIADIKLKIAEKYALMAWKNYEKIGDDYNKTELCKKFPQFFSELECETNPMNYHAMLKTIQALYKEIDLKKVIEIILTISIKYTGAYKAMLICHKNNFLLHAADIQQINNNSSPLFDYYSDFPVFKKSNEIKYNIIKNVCERKQIDIKNNICLKTNHKNENNPKAIMCIPIKNLDNLIGCIYLESNLEFDIYNELITIITEHISVSLSNALSFNELLINNKSRHKVLQERQEHLLHSGRLTSIGEIAEPIANEINHALKNMSLKANQLYDYFIKKNKDLNELKAMKVILSEIDRASSIVDNLTLYSDKEESNKSEFQSLENPIIICLSFFKSQFIKNKIQVNTSIQDNLLKINIDINKFKQIFINIISNAIHSVCEKSGITTKEYQKSININLYSTVDNKDKTLVLEIEDNGVGMTPDELKKCMNPFYTTKAKEHGTGMGLAIVQRLIIETRLHYNIESIKGKGCKFSLYAPISYHLIKNINKKEFKKMSRGKILIVDDLPEILDVNEPFLTKRGFEVYTAKSGKEAIELLKTRHIELIVTDIIMPGIDGIELIQEAKKFNKNIHAIVITGYSSIETCIRAMKAGAINFLKKPTKPEALLTAIEKGMEIVRLELDNNAKGKELKKKNEELEEKNKELEKINKELKEEKDKVVKLNENLKYEIYNIRVKTAWEIAQLVIRQSWTYYNWIFQKNNIADFAEYINNENGEIIWTISESNYVLIAKTLKQYIKKLPKRYNSANIRTTSLIVLKLMKEQKDKDERIYEKVEEFEEYIDKFEKLHALL